MPEISQRIPEQNLSVAWFARHRRQHLRGCRDPSRHDAVSQEWFQSLNVLSCSNTKLVNLRETSVFFFVLYCLGLYYLSVGLNHLLPAVSLLPVPTLIDRPTYSESSATPSADSTCDTIKKRRGRRWATPLTIGLRLSPLRGSPWCG